MASERTYWDGYDQQQHWWYMLLNDSNALRVVSLLERCGGVYTGTREEMARECAATSIKQLRRWLHACKSAGMIESVRGWWQASYRLTEAFCDGTMEMQALEIVKGPKGDLYKGPKGDLYKGPKGDSQGTKRDLITLYNKSNNSDNNRQIPANYEVGGDEKADAPQQTPPPDTTGMMVQAWATGYYRATKHVYNPKYSITSELRDLAGMIRHFIQHEMRQPPPTDEQVAQTLQLFVGKAYEHGDAWLKQHFELKYIINQFNSLIRKILDNDLTSTPPPDEPAGDTADTRADLTADDIVAG